MIGYGLTGPLHNHLNAIAIQKPPICLVLDPSEGSDVALKQRGVARVIGRVWKADEEIAARIMQNPVGAADWAMDVMHEPMRANPQIDWWQFSNEVCQTSVEGMRQLSRFSIALIDRMRARGLRAAIGGFSERNPDMPEHDRMVLWREFYPAMLHAKNHGGILLLHAYGAERLFGPGSPDWHLYRYERQVRPRLPDALQSIPYAYGEYGVDLGIIDRARLGWKTAYSGNYEQYAADLMVAARHLAASPHCLGACMYVVGGVNDTWLDFDLRGAPLEYMARLPWPKHNPAPLPAPAPAPAPGPHPGGWTQSDLALAIWFNEQFGRAIRDGGVEMDRLIGSLRAEGRRPGVHDAVVEVALRALYARRST